MSISQTEKLSPGQWSMNGVKFGKGTPYSVTNVQIQSYNVQAQDDQNLMSDELNMKQDSFMPTPITMEIGVNDFKIIPSMMALVNNKNFDETPYKGLLDKLSLAWRGDSVRRNYGQITPLKYCRRDGKVMTYYGRPRKFQATKASAKSSFYKVTAEFMRADTLVYADEENFQLIEQQADPVFINRTEGNCDAWLRILGYGPLSNPVITIGDQQIHIDREIGENEVFEVSSYPWQRRAVTSEGFNISSDLVGDTQYLDKLKISPNKATPVRWTASNVNTWVPTLESTSWANSLQGLNWCNLGSEFTQLWGQTVVHFDLFNDKGPTTYIGATWIGSTTAVLYAKKQFGTGKQYCQARLVEPWAHGGSAIVICSNSGMTNFAGIEARTHNFGPDEVRIISGTHPTAVTTRAAVNIGRDFTESDDLGIDYDYTTKTFRGYLNGEPIDGLSWYDNTNIVNPTNRYQGFIFDIGATFLTKGTGFADILAYDKDTALAPVGGIVIGWQDTYSSLEG